MLLGRFCGKGNWELGLTELEMDYDDTTGFHCCQGQECLRQFWKGCDEDTDDECRICHTCGFESNDYTDFEHDRCQKCFDEQYQAWRDENGYKSDDPDNECDFYGVLHKRDRDERNRAKNKDQKEGKKEVLEDLTCAQLKQRLRAINKPVGGRKADLIQRIREHEEQKEALFKED